MKLLKQPLFLLDPDPTSGGDPAPDPTPEPAPARTFTQEELDRIVQDRLARAKREEPADYKELKAQAAKWAEYEESQKTELEKAQNAAKAAQKEAAQAIARANQQLTDAAILTEASKAKMLKPEHAPLLVDKNSVTIGDDGQVTGAQEAVTAFLEANPEYVGKGRVADPVAQGARGTPTPGQITREELKGMSSAEIVKAQNEGRLNDLLGTNKQ